MINLEKIEAIYLFTGKTDLRASINGLSMIIQESFPIEMIRNKLFVFCNKDKRNIKVIELDYDGFWLYQKKLHRGKFRWPKYCESSQTMSIDKRQFRWLLDGLELIQKYAHEDIVIKANY